MNLNVKTPPSIPQSHMTFQGLDCYMWLVAAILDSACLAGQVRHIDMGSEHTHEEFM